VERVAEDHLVAEGLDLGALQRPDGRVRGKRNERRRVDVAVRKMQNARAG
jgi:hypothetical protein